MPASVAVQKTQANHNAPSPNPTDRVSVAVQKTQANHNVGDAHRTIRPSVAVQKTQANHNSGSGRFRKRHSVAVQKTQANHNAIVVISLISGSVAVQKTQANHNPGWPNKPAIKSVAVQKTQANHNTRQKRATSRYSVAVQKTQANHNTKAEMNNVATSVAVQKTQANHNLPCLASTVWLSLAVQKTQANHDITPDTIAHGAPHHAFLGGSSSQALREKSRQARRARDLSPRPNDQAWKDPWVSKLRVPASAFSLRQYRGGDQAMRSGSPKPANARRNPPHTARNSGLQALFTGRKPNSDRPTHTPEIRGKPYQGQPAGSPYRRDPKPEFWNWCRMPDSNQRPPHYE